MSDELRSALKRLSARVLGMVARGVVRLVNDSTGAQTLQIDVLEGETVDQVERLQAYGLTSHPKKGAEAVVVHLAGGRDHPIVIVVEDRRYRLTGLEEGEVVLHDDLGQRVHLKRDRIVVQAPLIELSDGTPLLGDDGVLTGKTIDSLTGATFAALGQASTKVRAAK